MEKITQKEKAAIHKMASSGGRKAAENMTPEERKLRAQKAVEAREVKRVELQLIPSQISRDITYIIHRTPGDKYLITYEDGRVHDSGQMKYLRVFLRQPGKASQREIERIGRELDQDGQSRITVTRHSVSILG
jgi:hypothetical protein